MDFLIPFSIKYCKFSTAPNLLTFVYLKSVYILSAMIIAFFVRCLFIREAPNVENPRYYTRSPCKTSSSFLYFSAFVILETLSYLFDLLVLVISLLFLIRTLFLFKAVFESSCENRKQKIRIKRVFIQLQIFSFKL